jgi:hypothetical protein
MVVYSGSFSCCLSRRGRSLAENHAECLTTNGEYGNNGSRAG